MIRPQLHSFSNHLHEVVNDLWNDFLKNSRETKKILKYIFFDKENTVVDNEEIDKSGFEDVYHTYSKAEIL